ncbi:hypothetical protein ACFQ6E_06775 [Streptomyces sp. NPDC056462]|uniref:hypothetical protein n=1 Tax=Streptomyces sp. NPDC056462 TaxID=3345826 RepID=UPI0036C52C9C
MGIRTLNRRTSPAPANANTEDAPTARPTVPLFAPGASTARIPADLMGALRHRATTLRGYLALARTALPRRRPGRSGRTVTVFVATADTVTEPPDGSAPDRPHPHPHPNCQGPGPDATP